MFSKTCEYALRALMYIAQKTKDGARLSVVDVANDINSSEYFMAKILQQLAKKGFVSSAKGPNGGFFMEDKNRQTPLAQIVEFFDGDKIFLRCTLGLQQCSEVTPCPLHKEFVIIRKRIKDILETSTIESFIGDLEMQRTFLKSK